MAFEIGQVTHGYEFIEKLDSSGTGITYKVRNQLADRLETLKVLSRDLQKDHEQVQRFLREVKIHAHLNHPNIAMFYNAFEIDGEIVMTVETVEGRTLAEIASAGPIPLPRALDYAKQALDALQYAHANGVIHRNITPTSLVVGSNGTVKVGEFELARSETDPRLTLTGMVMGPMHYISPEQVKGGDNIDARADVYSFGMVLFEILTGRKAFDSDIQFEVMQAHVNKLPDPPTQVNPELPPEVDEVILKAIVKDPAYRYQSAGEFRHALNALLPARKEEAAANSMATQPASSDVGILPSSVSGLEEQEPKPAPAESATPLDITSLDPRVIGLMLFFIIAVIGVIASLLFRPR